MDKIKGWKKEVTEEFEKMLPPHEGGITIQHNDHKGVYETVEQYTDAQPDYYTWVSEEEKQKAIAANDFWFMQWYPRTPVGFNSYCASDLKVLLDFAKSITDGS